MATITNPVVMAEIRGRLCKTRRDREYMDQLLKTPPAYIIVGVGHGSSDKAKLVSDFPELARFLRERFELETQIGWMDLYHLLE